MPLVELLSSYGVFAAGYFARPIGGIVLSHFGDRYGRRNVFLLSLFAMSGATLAMGLVPTYAVWGVAASITMVCLRLLQGFCIGGELPGALTYVVETAPKQAALVCGVVFACVTYGVAVATGVSVGVRTFLPPELVPEYGWRIAFILGGLGGIVSFVARRAMEESPEFAQDEGAGGPSAVPRGAAVASRRGAHGHRHSGALGRVQRPLLLAHAGLSRARARLRRAAGGGGGRPSASSSTPR